MITTIAKGQNTGSLVRYRNEVFSKIKVHKDLVYEIRTGDDTVQHLALDLYLPENDTLKHRPLIVFMHGGGFTLGSKSDTHTVQFCRYFARLGYATASVGYRLGVSGYSIIAYGQAIYNGTQDARSAVRWLRSNATKYGIDADNIFLGGGSAGAFNALHAAYMTPSDVPVYLSGFGDLDVGSNLNVTSDVQAVINCFGAVIDTQIIREGSAPIVSIHGERDSVVPYKSHIMGPFGIYGSYYLDQRAREVGVKSKLLVFPEQGHGLSPNDTARWQVALNTIRDFLYEIVQPAGPSVKEPEGTVSKKAIAEPVATQASTEVASLPGTAGMEPAFRIYPNPATEWVQFQNKRSIPVSRLAILSVQGQQLADLSVSIAAGREVHIPLKGVPTGTYLVRLHWEDGKQATERIVVK